MVRIVTVRGKWRAQAADVLVDVAVHERSHKEKLEADNAALRGALWALVNVIDYGGFDHRTGVFKQLHKAVAAAKRALAAAGHARAGP